MMAGDGNPGGSERNKKTEINWNTTIKKMVLHRTHPCVTLFTRKHASGTQVRHVGIVELWILLSTASCKSDNLELVKRKSYRTES